VSPRRLAATPDNDALIRLLAKAIAPYLREDRLRRAEPTPEYYHQGDSPLGRRRHLDLVRGGVLAGRKVGRRVLVRRDDVHAHIEARNAGRLAIAPVVDDPLEDWGLVRTERQ